MDGLLAVEGSDVGVIVMCTVCSLVPMLFRLVIVRLICKGL